MYREFILVLVFLDKSPSSMDSGRKKITMREIHLNHLRTTNFGFSQNLLHYRV